MKACEIKPHPQWKGHLFLFVRCPKCEAAFTDLVNVSSDQHVYITYTLWLCAVCGYRKGVGSVIHE